MNINEVIEIYSQPDYFDKEFLETLEENAIEFFCTAKKIKAYYTDNCIMLDITIIEYNTPFDRVRKFEKDSLLPLENIANSDNEIVLTFCELKEAIQPC